MASRYIARKYGDSSQARSRTSSVVRESSSRASSQVRDNSSYYSRGTSASRSRSSTPTEYSSGSSYNTNQDYYRGKTKSIYERNSLFNDFVSSLPSASTTTNMYNSGNLTCLKEQFQTMVQDKWSRKQMGDPSVCHDMALKTSGWSNYIGKSSESASESLGRKHSRAMLETSHYNLPNITVYHRSTL